MDKTDHIQLKGYDYFVAVNDGDLNNNIAYVIELADQPDLNDMRKNIQENILPYFPLLSCVLFNRGQKPYMKQISELSIEKIVIAHKDTLAMSNLDSRAEIAELIGQPFTIEQPLWRIVALKQELSDNIVKNYLLLIYNHMIGDATLGTEFLSLLAGTSGEVKSFGKSSGKGSFVNSFSKGIELFRAIKIKSDAASPIFKGQVATTVEMHIGRMSLASLKSSVSVKEFYDASRRLGVSKTALTAAVLSSTIKKYLAGTSRDAQKNISAFFSLASRNTSTPIEVFERERGNYFRSGSIKLFLEEENAQLRLLKINKYLASKGKNSAEVISRLLEISSHLPKSIFEVIAGPPPQKAFDMSFLPFFTDEVLISGCRVKDITFHVNGHESGSCFYLSTYNGNVSISLTNMDGSIRNPEEFISIANDCLREIVHMPPVSNEIVTISEIMEYFKNQPIFR